MKHTGFLLQNYLDEVSWKNIRSDHLFELMDAIFCELTK